MRDTLRDALDLLARGFTPVPCNVSVYMRGKLICTCCNPSCHTPGKHPAVKWKPYQDTKPSAQEITEWFNGRFKLYNCAVVHGAMSDTVLLDWDGADGMQTLSRLENSLGALPPTPTVLSGGGGIHQIFRRPCFVQTRKGIRDHFDVRGDGGISVMPPSLHQSGRFYEWDADNHIDDVPIADLPPAWVKLITADQISETDQKVSGVVWTGPQNASLVTDGREEYMRNVVFKTLHRLIRNLLRNPTIEELIAAAWDSYAPNVDLTKPGRGYNELVEKCKSTYHNLLAGRIATRLVEPPSFC